MLIRDSTLNNQPNKQTIITSLFLVVLKVSLVYETDPDESKHTLISSIGYSTHPRFKVPLRLPVDTSTASFRSALTPNNQLFDSQYNNINTTDTDKSDVTDPFSFSSNQQKEQGKNRKNDKEGQDSFSFV